MTYLDPATLEELLKLIQQKEPTLSQHKDVVLLTRLLEDDAFRAEWSEVLATPEYFDD